jgi:hypothetical protein
VRRRGDAPRQGAAAHVGAGRSAGHTVWYRSADQTQ